MKTRLVCQRFPVMMGVWMLGILACFVLGPGAHALPPQAQKPPEPKRYALLVGVNQYQKQGLFEKPLQYAERDVIELGELLRGQGFEKVITLTNEQATRAGIETARNNLLKNCKATDLVVLAFAGHGVQLDLRDDKNDLVLDEAGSPLTDAYFCPVDAVKGDASTMISLIHQFDTLSKVGGINLVLADCCRDNPEEASKRSGRSFSWNDLVSRLPRNSALLMACEADQKALEHATAGGGHGLFFHQVIEGLKGAAASKTGDITWERLAVHVRETVDEQAIALSPNDKRSPDGTLQQPQAVSNLVARPVLARVDVRKLPIDESMKRPTNTNAQKPAGSFAASLGIKLVPIKPGSFMMGSTPDQIATLLQLYPNLHKAGDCVNEQPAHRVEITKPFSLGAHEITVGQFRAFVNDTNYQTSAEKDGEGGYGFDKATGELAQTPQFSWKNAGFIQSDDHPVVNVSWNDARAFCEWLTRKEGPGVEYRLPTEAEWEYACRAGTTTLFPTGNDPEQLVRVGNVADGTMKQKFAFPTIAASDGFVFTAPVGHFAPNPWGLYDMVGNVFEWCLDGYDRGFYQQSAVQDPRGAEGATYRVIRGGSWNLYSGSCRPASRSAGSPDNRYNGLGFRVARVPAPVGELAAPKPEQKPPSTVGDRSRSAGEEIADNGLQMKLCWCPPGSFQMGSSPNEPGRSDDEGPVQVRLTHGFWLGKYEVTQGEWQQVMGTLPDDLEKGNDARFPIYNVSHNEAVSFCKKLTAQERAAGRLAANEEYRLPMEAEWEYGCRAGTKTITPFGDSLSSTQANFNGAFPYNGGAKGPYLKETVAVGSYAPNGWGLCDTVGNVWEWCSDWYGENLRGGDDPAGPSTASSRVVRGGSWFSIGVICRPATRYRINPDFRDFNLGFRVARVPVQ